MHSRTYRNLKKIIGVACVSMLGGCPEECESTTHVVVSGLEVYETIEVDHRTIYVGQTDYTFTVDCEDVELEGVIYEADPLVDYDYTGAWSDQQLDSMVRLEESGITRAVYTVTPDWDAQSMESAKVWARCELGQPENIATPLRIFLCGGTECTH